jgi:glycine oxidase
MAAHSDCLIIGGGVMGLSIAYELSGQGLRVTVIDRTRETRQPDDAEATNQSSATLRSPAGGRQASWAGAGIIPPAHRGPNPHFAEQLHALSYDLHLEWAKQLLSETGIDNGLSRCGAIYLARSLGEAAALRANLQMFDHQLIRARLLEQDELLQSEPALHALVNSGSLRAAIELPDEMQIRNPRHLQALRVACQKQQVQFVESASSDESTAIPSQIPKSQPRFQVNNHRVIACETDGRRFSADQFVLAAGAWSFEILKSFGIALPVFPMRGQILLFRAVHLNLQRIINEGPRYVVPRGDGLFLVGSMEEEVGFQNFPTRQGKLELLAFAQGVLPELNADSLIDHWSGLRPATLDGLPFVGKLSEAENLFYATGHYRSGLTMSTGTARLIRQMMLGEPTTIDIGGLGIQRGL